MITFPSKFLSDNRQSKIKIVNSAGVVAIGVTLAMCGAGAQAQQAKKIPRVGFLGATSPSAVSARLDAFRQGLRELGYVEGKNILIEYRYAEGKLDRLPALAAELVRLKVDVGRSWPVRHQSVPLRKRRTRFPLS